MVYVVMAPSVIAEMISILPASVDLISMVVPSPLGVLAPFRTELVVCSTLISITRMLRAGILMMLVPLASVIVVGVGMPRLSNPHVVPAVVRVVVMADIILLLKQFTTTSLIKTA